MNRRELSRRAAERCGIPAIHCETAVAAFFEELAEALADGEEVQCRGFGTFYTVARAPRHGYSVENGERVKITIPECLRPSFRPSEELRRKVNEL